MTERENELYLTAAGNEQDVSDNFVGQTVEY